MIETHSAGLFQMYSSTKLQTANYGAFTNKGGELLKILIMLRLQRMEITGSEVLVYLSRVKTLRRLSSCSNLRVN